MTDDFRQHWSLDRDVAFLNHGSFGACPTPVLARQQAWRERMERQPVQFFARDLPGLLDQARQALGRFLQVSPEHLAWVSNATAGVNAVLQSLPLNEGDELLTLDHEYNACRNVLDYVAERTRARVKVATLPLPITHPSEVLNALRQARSQRTRLVLIDHVTSPTGLILPLQDIAADMRANGIRVLVDGAHAPGMLPLDIEALGVDYYTGNCHKWLCAPKGAGFLWVAAEHQHEVRPAIISHGANAPTHERPRFRNEFDWTGTADPSAILSVPEALEFMAALVPGGWPEIYARNRALVLQGRNTLHQVLGGELLAPASMIGSLAAHPLPPGSSSGPPSSMLYTDALQTRLLEHCGVEVPIVPWPAPPARLVRLSAQLYNTPAEYERLAESLVTLLRE
ncbi:MAG: aminotransferase class V-fold PLP-dependent enzyme [Pseudomonadota bacterium]